MTDEFEKHNHWQLHHARIIEMDGKEYLHLICKIDGVVFHEVELHVENKEN